MKEHRDKTATPAKKLPFWRMVLSVIQASFGVQSEANKERDFEQGSIAGFILAAILFTTLFVLSLLAIVSLVLD
ncbi:MAG: DUF2970 domain-containing protein [Pseudomonadales bacterium]|nr:DUF2970 domain-containing protein [Pseudomonadales bacterium]